MRRSCRASASVCAALAARSGPARDQQVLAAELQRQGLEASAQRLRQQAEEGCQALLESDELPQLFRVLDGLPPFWRLARREGCLRRLRRRVRHGLARQRAGLRERLQAPEPDWHRLRLQVKQLRYAAQAYPALAGLSSAELELLQRLQAVLGDWHDAQQWLALAERAPELAGCRADWQARQAQAVAQVGPLLDCLGQAWGVPAPAECPAICGLV